MAIPIGLQYSEDAEDSYRSLDLLLEQLLITLRQVLMHRRRELAANARTQTVRQRHAPSGETPVPTEEQISDQIHETTRVSPEMVSSQNLPLPDLILASSLDCQNPQEQKEARTADVSETTTATATADAQTHGWVQVGADLKRIADQLLATNRLDQKEEKKGKMKDENVSLLSLFCPPLGGPVWTTVALLVGWSILSRTR